MSTKSTGRKNPLAPINDLIDPTIEHTAADTTTEPPIKRLFGTIYLWRPKQRIFFRSLYLWEREGTTNEYYFGTNESICNVIIKNTSTVSPIHAKIRLHEGKVELLGLAEGRILKVCLPSANPGLPRSISKGSQRGNQVWYVDDVECGGVQELEDWSVFSVERKVFMIRMPDDRTRMKEKDEIAYCFGEESPFNKVFGLVHQLKKCNYKFIKEDEDEDEDVEGNNEGNDDETNEENKDTVSKDDDKNIDKEDKEVIEMDVEKDNETPEQPNEPVEATLSEVEKDDSMVENHSFNEKDSTEIDTIDNNKTDDGTDGDYVSTRRSTRERKTRYPIRIADSEESTESEIQSSSESEWSGESESDTPKKPTRGRKRKCALKRKDSGSTISDGSESDLSDASNTPKKTPRGRKLKYTMERLYSDIGISTSESDTSTPSDPIKNTPRGRKRKYTLESLGLDTQNIINKASTSESDTPQKTMKGRKSKYTLESLELGSQSTNTSESEISDVSDTPKKSRRGRKIKYTLESLGLDTQNIINKASDVSGESDVSDIPKNSVRGRKRKYPSNGAKTGGGSGSGGVPQMKVGEGVRAPAGMKLRYSRNGKHFDVDCVWDLCNRFHLHRAAMVGLTMGEAESLGTWHFDGVYDPKRRSLRADLKPIVLK